VIYAWRRGFIVFMIDDEYYTSCKYEKDWILENYPLLVEDADSRLKEPDNQPVDEAVLTPYGCAFLLRALPMKLFPQTCSAIPANLQTSTRMT
jgi:hypothetical protein